MHTYIWWRCNSWEFTIRVVKSRHTLWHCEKVSTEWINQTVTACSSEMEEEHSQMEIKNLSGEQNVRLARTVHCAAICSQQFNLFTHVYHTIGLVYKFSWSSPAHECHVKEVFRSFIKQHFRSRVSQDSLEVLMLLVAEKEILMNVDSWRSDWQGCGEKQTPSQLVNYIKVRHVYLLLNTVAVECSCHVLMKLL